MSKVLFVNGNLHGHINPTLPLVRELTKRGEEVYYFSTIEFKLKLEANGAIFMDYGEEMYQFLHNFHPHGNHPFYTLMEYILAFDRTAISIVLKKTAGISFDYMIHDAMFGGGNILAGQLKIPAICSCSSFVMEKPPLPAHMLEPDFHPQLSYLYGEMAAAKAEWDVNSLQINDLFFKKEDLNIVYTSRLFQPLGESFDTSYRFVGPSVTDREEVLDFLLHKSHNTKIIYISLGTVNNSCIDFYNKCFEAFRGQPCQVIMSVGYKTDVSCLKQIPDNFIVRSYFPQLEIIKNADIVISHGGLNSVSEALFYGVPVIAIPIANDQPAVAKRLTELGAGISLKMEEVTPKLLQASVNAVLSDHKYYLNCKRIRESFMEAGGYKKATDEIINYLRQRREAIENIMDIVITCCAIGKL